MTNPIQLMQLKTKRKRWKSTLKLRYQTASILAKIWSRPWLRSYANDRLQPACRWRTSIKACCSERSCLRNRDLKRIPSDPNIHLRSARAAKTLLQTTKRRKANHPSSLWRSPQSSKYASIPRSTSISTRCLKRNWSCLKSRFSWRSIWTSCPIDEWSNNRCRSTRNSGGLWISQLLLLRWFTRTATKSRGHSICFNLWPWLFRSLRRMKWAVGHMIRQVTRAQSWL